MTSTPPVTTPERAPGEIITFYSYKGGTGRSMALANVACLLAAQVSGTGRGVLMVDWDLEAPGLHRYFQGAFNFEPLYKAGKLYNQNLHQHFQDAFNFDSRYEEGLVNNHPGLVNLFFDIMAKMKMHGDHENEDDAVRGTAHAVKQCMTKGYVLPLKVNNLYLLKAGRFDDEYSTHVSKLDWEEMYRRWPWLIRALAERWAEDYDYVLIDSRTGLTDTSGICTVLMPEKLVVVFTPNRQSFTGVENLVRKASKYRKESDDLRPLVVFPLPSRIEASREDLRKLWRFGDEARGVAGYQPLFEKLIGDVYSLPPEQCDLGEYFDEVQIQQTADYAYGEEIAVRVEQQIDRFSLTRSYQTFTERLVKSEGPWKRPPEEKPEQVTSEVGSVKAAVLAGADAFYAALSPEEQQRALRLLARLVTVAPVIVLRGVDFTESLLANMASVAPTGEGSRDTIGLAKYMEIEEAARPAINSLVKAGLVVASRDVYRDVQGEEPTFEAADEALVREWKPLREWIDKNRDFLVWRQKLKTYLSDWEQGGRSKEDLLSGSSLAAAKHYAAERAEDLNAAESAYIQQSAQHNSRGGAWYSKFVSMTSASIIALIMFGPLMAVVAFFVWLFYKVSGAYRVGVGVIVAILLVVLAFFAYIFYGVLQRKFEEKEKQEND